MTTDAHFNSYVHITGIQSQPDTHAYLDGETIFANLTFDHGRLDSEQHRLVVSGNVDNMLAVARAFHHLADQINLEVERLIGQQLESEQADNARAREDEADQWRMNR